MPITEERLRKWSELPDTGPASSTYNSVRSALEGSGSKIRALSTDIYLQGSYANHTNTRRDSDVDIVVELQSTFQPGLSRLSQDEKAAFSRIYSDATYGWDQFREDVLQTLVASFGSTAVRPGHKCINVSSVSNLQADVVPALEYRDFRSFSDTHLTNYYEGISFFSLPERNRIVNYPKEHRKNGEGKNRRTSDRYKPAVRMFKNARKEAVQQGLLAAEDAPSYFLECLIYNAPDTAFAGSAGILYFSVIQGLLNQDLSALKCGNEVTPLFGSGDTQWELDAAVRTIRALIEVVE